MHRSILAALGAATLGVTWAPAASAASVTCSIQANWTEVFAANDTYTGAFNCSGQSDDISDCTVQAFVVDALTEGAPLGSSQLAQDSACGDHLSTVTATDSVPGEHRIRAVMSFTLPAGDTLTAVKGGDTETGKFSCDPVAGPANDYLCTAVSTAYTNP